MQSEYGGSAAADERRGRLQDLIRASVAAWDSDAEVRASARPDGKIDMTIVSCRFEGLDSRDREASFWPALDPVPKSEMVYLTYCLLLTPEEAERSFSGATPHSESEDWDE
jgi:hypothetical protein